MARASRTSIDMSIHVSARMSMYTATIHLPWLLSHSRTIASSPPAIVSNVGPLLPWPCMHGIVLRYQCGAVQCGAVRCRSVLCGTSMCDFGYPVCFGGLLGASLPSFKA